MWFQKQQQRQRNQQRPTARITKTSGLDLKVYEMWTSIFKSLQQRQI